MRKNFLVFLGVFLFLSLEINSQGLSPLVPYVSTNQLINRPEVFREFQTQLDDKIASTKPGIQLEFIYSQLSELRTKYIDDIAAPEITLSDDKQNLELKFSFLKLLGVSDEKIKVPTIDTTIKTFEKLTESLQHNFDVKFKDYLAKYINKAFEQSFKLQVFRKPILYALNKIMEEENFINATTLTQDQVIKLLNDYKESDVDKLFNNISTQVTNIITANLMKKMSEILGEKFTKEFKLENKDDIKNFTSEYIDPLKIYFNDIMGSALSGFKSNLNKAEVEVRELVEDASKSLISGNVGMSLSEGEGDFAGGLQYTYKADEDFLFGFYLNGKLSSADTTESPKSLIGGQFKWVPLEKLEVAGLLSYYFGAANYKSLQAHEFGGGLSYNTGGLIVGLSYFYLNQSGTTKDISYPNNHTYGLFVRGNSPDSPIMFLGGSNQTDQKANFGFQIIYPINSK